MVRREGDKEPEWAQRMREAGMPLTMNGTRYAHPYCPIHPWLERKASRTRWFCSKGGATWSTTHWRIEAEDFAERIQGGGRESGDAVLEAQIAAHNARLDALDKIAANPAALNMCYNPMHGWVPHEHPLLVPAANPAACSICKKEVWRNGKNGRMDYCLCTQVQYRERIRALEAELAARKETFGEFRNETFAEFYARHHHGPHERFPGCSFCDEEAAARKEAKA